MGSEAQQRNYMANRSLFRNQHLSPRSSGVGVQEWREAAEG